MEQTMMRMAIFWKFLNRTDFLPEKRDPAVKSSRKFAMTECFFRLLRDAVYVVAEARVLNREDAVRIPAQRGGGHQRVVLRSHNLAIVLSRRRNHRRQLLVLVQKVLQQIRTEARPSPATKRVQSKK
jgi:hypothetical protein